MQSLQKSKLLAVLMFFIVVFQSGHAFQTIYPILSYLIYIPAILCVLILTVTRDITKITKPQITMLYILITMIVFTTIVELGSGAPFYIRMAVTILAALCITELYSFKQIATCYLKTMTWVSVIALIGYFLVNLLKKSML